MRFSLWLALRHLAKSRRGGFLGRVSVLALAGVGIGVATLLVVFAFVQGFQQEVLGLLTGMNPGIFVSAAQRGGLDAQDSALLALTELPGVEASSPFIQQKGVLSTRSGRGLKLRGIILRGVDPLGERAVTSLLDRCDPPFAGFDFPGPPGVLLGVRLAEELGVLPGESITFTTLLDGGGERATHFDFTVIGMVSTGLHEFDRRFAYVDLGVARAAFRAGGGSDGLGLRLSRVDGVDRTSEALRARLDFQDYRVASWRDLNGEIFRWIATMRSVLFLALSLIILVAGFNIAGTMTIIVTEKTREIGLLLALGASRRDVLAVFLIEGWLLGLAGVCAGGVLGTAFVLWFKDHPLPLPGEVYFIDHLPAALSPTLFLSIGSAAILVAFFALVLPGLEALRRLPLESLQGGKEASVPELLSAVGISRSFVTPHRRVEVLRDCTLALAAGEALSILGASGSGKSTLLHILGTLDTPNAGRLHYRGRDLLAASVRERSAFRRSELGFIFQFHHLLPEFSAEENVALPGLIGGGDRQAAFAEARALLAQVGLDERCDHRPGELSGGEQQRVAVARALMGEPSLVLADEPTGNLDEETGREVADLLFSLCRDAGVGLVLVTHDETQARRADRRLALEVGGLVPV